MEHDNSEFEEAFGIYVGPHLVSNTNTHAARTRTGTGTHEATGWRNTHAARTRTSAHEGVEAAQAGRGEAS
jgi:hypothetical protein